jgi:hypothetical protein
MERFETAVRHFFGPMLGAEGMLCVGEARDHVRYESEDVFLQVSFDWRRWGEISVAIGRRERSPEMFPFDLADVLRAYGYINMSEIELLRGSTVVAIDEAVGTLAGLTGRYALELLRNNHEEFLYVATCRKWASLKYAWDTNKPKSVIAAYRSMIVQPCYERVRKTFDAQDLEILERASRLSESAGDFTSCQ